MPAELQRRAQDSVRECVARADAQGRVGRGWVVPLAAATAGAAAACAPVVWPLLVAAGAGASAGVVGVALSQIGGVGGGLLSEAVIRAWDRLRSRGRPDDGQAGLRDALAAELEAGLTLGTPAAAVLRSEVAGVLQGVGAVQVALTATVEESAAGVRQVLVQGLRELGDQFTEFGWVLDEVNRQLSVIAEDVAQTAATTRLVADHQQQTLVELAMLRQEARGVFRYRARRPGSSVSAGLSADEERAAALDAAEVSVSPECPYPGLAAFQPEDADRFCGRQQLTAALAARAGEQLARPGLLMVVGPSGSGKSSLLRAGLLPAIAAGALPARGSSAWPRDLMTPGRRPLTELATRIASLAGIPAGALEADLRTDPTGITSAIRQALLTNARRQPCTARLAPADPVVADLDTAGQQADEPDDGPLTAERQTAAGPRLVVIVDQFEEIFTQGADEQERRLFVEALCAAAGTATPDLAAEGGPRRGQVDAREAPALVVIGIRADFYARTAAYPQLAPHLQDHQVLVGPIDEAGLREAIERPATTAGLVVDAALVEVLLADLGLRVQRDGAPVSGMQDAPAGANAADRSGYEAGRLALLSYALQQTWRNRDGRRLTVAGYRATGGIDGAIAQAADNVYDRLDRAGRQTLQRVLLRLVTLGDGTPDSRRRVSFAELIGSEDSTQVALTRAVLADLIDARLVTADADTVEITHETLLTAWPRLRQWLTDDRAGLRIHRDLTDAAREWQHENRDPGRMFRGIRLAVARDWAAHHSQDLNASERAFLSASQHAQRRATRRRRIAVATLAALTILAGSIAGVAFQQRSDALTARDQAIANQIAVEVDQLTPTDPSLAAELDVAANQLESTSDAETRLVEAADTPLASRLTGPAGSGLSVAISPDGRIAAVGSSHGTVQLWNLTDPARPARLGSSLTGPSEGLDGASLAFSPDGRILAAGGSFPASTVRLWSLADPARPAPLGLPLIDHTGDVNAVAISPDRRILAAASSDGTVQLWSLTDPARPAPLRPLTGSVGSVDSVAFSPDGRTLAAGDSVGTVWLWNFTDPAHPALLRKLTGPRKDVDSAAFSPNGSILATGNSDGTVQLWGMTDPARPVPLRTLTGPQEGVNSVAFSPDGRILATGNSDATVRLWNVTRPAYPAQLGQPLTGTTSSVNSVAFSPNGTLAAASSGTVQLWNFPPDLLTIGPSSAVDPVAFSPDGHILAAGSSDGTVWLWNLSNPARPAPLGPPLTIAGGEGVTSMAFSPDGRILAAGNGYGPVQLWSLTDPARPALLSPPPTGLTIVSSLAFSPRAPILATGNGSAVQLWSLTDPARPVLLAQLRNGAMVLDSLAFSSTGRTLAVGGYGSKYGVVLWTLANLARPALLPGPLVNSLAFSPDRRFLAAGTGASSGTVWLWNGTNLAHPVQLSQPLTGPAQNVNSVAFSPDGHILATGNSDGTVWLWSLTDPAHPARLGLPLTSTGEGSVNSVAFSPDGHILATGSADGAVRLWDLDVDDAIQRICSTTSNTLKPSEWKQYIPQLPYDPPCAHPAHYGLLVH